MAACALIAGMGGFKPVQDGQIMVIDFPGRRNQIHGGRYRQMDKANGNLVPSGSAAFQNRRPCLLACEDGATPTPMATDAIAGDG